MTEIIVWGDVETTGLYANDPDQLLEVAVLITDYDLNVLDEHGFQAVIQHDARAMFDLADDYVKAMHDKTGLWDRLAMGLPPENVDEYLVDYIQAFQPEPKTARLAGNSVRLDANFIEAFLPQVSAHLHYRVLDVSSLAFEFNEVLDVPDFEKVRTHVAMDDIRESIAELRHYRRHYGTAMRR